jgi:hypothetical protein
VTSDVRSMLSLNVVDAEGAQTRVSTRVERLFNFGYAGRDQSGVREHVEHLRALGIQAPSRVPALFPIPPDRVTTAEVVVVIGGQTYGEVEFALINTLTHGWVVTIASDHTDLEVERVNMPKAKGICPDVIGMDAWPFADVAAQWDRLTLRMWGHAGDERTLTQDGAVGDLLHPDALIEALERRSGSASAAGTVILSGTVAGGPVAGMSAWSAELADPSTGRRIALAYEVRSLDEEI